MLNKSKGTCNVVAEGSSDRMHVAEEWHDVGELPIWILPEWLKA
jgi:hypothetical protein